MSGSPSKESNGIARVEALTSTARSTWLVCLGVFTFFAITALGTKDIDFYGIDQVTRLPLINTDVPTRTFFALSPLLAAVIYGYFHIYLIRLWDALAEAPARIDESPLGDCVKPWLVTESALYLRNWFRGDSCVSPRTLDPMVTALSMFSTWLFGPLVIALMWWQSMTARDLLLGLVASLGLISCCTVGATSFYLLQLRMRGATLPRHGPWSTAPFMSGLLLILVGCLWLTSARTTGSLKGLAPVDLSNTQLVTQSNMWIPHREARHAYLETWCKQAGANVCADGSEPPEFQSTWKQIRAFEIAHLPKPDFTGINLNGSVLQRVFMPGLSLKDASLQRADFSYSILEEAEFNGADLSDAVLFEIDGTNADFDKADLRGTRFINAKLSGATFRQTKLWGIRLGDADLRKALFSYNYIAENNLQNALSTASRLLSFISFGQKNAEPSGPSLDMRGTVVRYAAIRNLDLSGMIYDSQTNLKTAFLDGTVILPVKLQNAENIPCQWTTKRISDDAEYFGRWRGWVEFRKRRTFDPNWVEFAPAGWEDVKPIPPENCRR